MSFRIAQLVTTLGLLAAAAHGDVIYVDDSAPPGGDGRSWATAHRHLQDALSRARGRSAIEIRVGDGVHRPDRSATDPSGSGDRAATFVLSHGMTLVGGFAGVGAVDPDEQDAARFVTTLDGDLATDDGPDPASLDDNAFHVVTVDEPAADVTLIGVRIRGGHATADPSVPARRGGGVRVVAASVALIECRLLANHASVGGAIAVDDGALELQDCLLLDNRAISAGAVVLGGAGTLLATDSLFHGNVAEASGGAILATAGAGMQFIRCDFIENQAEGGLGGAVACFQAEVTIEACEWQGNTALLSGGALLASSSQVSVTGGEFAGNYSDSVGGALSAGNDSVVVLNQCSFIANQAWSRGGAIDGGYIEAVACDFTGNAAVGRTSSTGRGGAAYLTGGFVLEHCTFSANAAQVGGGAWLTLSSATPPDVIQACVFRSNESSSEGGAIYFSNFGDALMENVILTGNSAATCGGALRITSSVAASHCTFHANTAGEAGDDIRLLDSGSLVLTNSILEHVPVTDAAPIVVGHSLIQGLGDAYPGCGNITGDPRFVDPLGPDGVPGTGDEDLSLAPGSPAIDAGDPYFVGGPDDLDLAGALRVQHCRVDIGAYESPVPAGDCNGDGVGDACEPDCDDDGVPDGCAIDLGLVEDCDGNGVPDACDVSPAGGADCNGNGTPDPCDIATGAALDCDGNGIPDDCDIAPLFTAASPLFFPLGGGAVHTFTLSDPPLATGPVLVRAFAAGDFDGNAERLILHLNGQPVAELFVAGAACPSDLELEEITLDPALFNALVTILGPDATFEITTTPQVDPDLCQPCAPSRARLEVLYPAQGGAADTNGDGVPDVCATPGDVTGDGVVDVQDLVAVILAWGACPPEPEPCPADLDGSGGVDVADLVTVILGWSG